MGHFLSTLAGVPLGDVLVNDVQTANISGHNCLTASIRVTGVDGMCGEDGGMRRVKRLYNTLTKELQRQHQSNDSFVHIII